MRDLEIWGVPSYVVDIWEKNYSRCLLPVQEEAVRDYGVLDYNGRNNGGRNGSYKVTKAIIIY